MGSEPDGYFSTIPHAPQVSTGNRGAWPSGLPIALFKELMLTCNDKTGGCGYKAFTKWLV